MREVLAAREPSVVEASSMSSSGGPMWPICHTWSITDSFAKPASSAVCATRLRSWAIRLGPPVQVNFETCTPSRMLRTLTTPHFARHPAHGIGHWGRTRARFVQFPEQSRLGGGNASVVLVRGALAVLVLRRVRVAVAGTLRGVARLGRS